jgi:hypothetical protein
LRFPLRPGSACFLTASYSWPSIPAARAGRRGSSSGWQAISGVVREEIQAGHIPGAVVVVGIGGRIVYRQAFGLAPSPRARRP